MTRSAQRLQPGLRLLAVFLALALLAACSPGPIDPAAAETPAAPGETPAGAPTPSNSPTPAAAAVRATRLSPAEAEVLVRTAVQAQNPNFNPAGPLTLEEITPEDAWERLGAQVFVTGGEVLNGDAFAVAGGQAEQIATGFGGPGLLSMHVTDLDGDGQAELVYSYGFGSGLHRSHVGIYSPAWGPPHHLDAPLAYLGGDLTLEKIDDQQVQVLRMEPAKGSGPNPAPEPFGRLRLEGAPGQPVLEIDLDPGLPPSIMDRIVK